MTYNQTDRQTDRQTAVAFRLFRYALKNVLDIRAFLSCLLSNNNSKNLKVRSDL